MFQNKVYTNIFIVAMRIAVQRVAATLREIVALVLLLPAFQIDHFCVLVENNSVRPRYGG